MVCSPQLMMKAVLQTNSQRNYTSRAFSLIEVVVAVGIFAIAIVSVIGLLGPINKSVADVRDFDDASRVVNAIQGKLQSAGFDNVREFINAGTVIYASKDGSKVAPGTDTSVWTNGNADKFFAITLTRNWDASAGTGLSNPANDNTAGYLAFTISLRWPAYTFDGTAYTAINANTDQSAQQGVMIVPAAITR